MNEKNPYASPSPTEDDFTKTAPPTPQTFRQALLQGLKFGFKWGNRIGLLIVGLNMFALISIPIHRSITSGEIPDFGALFSVSEVLSFIMGMLLFYAFICVLGIVCGLVLSTMIHVVRKGIRLLK